MRDTERERRLLEIARRLRDGAEIDWNGLGIRASEVKRGSMRLLAELRASADSEREEAASPRP